MQKIIFDGQTKTVFLCPYCGYESSSFEDAKAHDATCSKHPAVIRAARLEKEADWLAERLSIMERRSFPDCAQAGEVWRKIAREAVEEKHDE